MKIVEPKVSEFYQQGLSAWEVSAKLGLSRSFVYRTLRKLGISRTMSQAQHLRFDKGYKANQTEGGRAKSGGYVVVQCPNHPKAMKSGYVFEHILIWEETHNQPLPDGWVVHHLNGIKNDNRPCNLVGMPSRKHQNVLSAKAQRIRELEVEVKLLEKVLDSSQMIFRLEEN